MRWPFVLAVLPAVISDLSHVGAQQRTPLGITRVFTGPDNQSHAEKKEVQFALGNTVLMIERSDRGKATGVQFNRLAPGDRGQHNAPERQYVITLSGSAEIELFDGQRI